MGKKLTNITKKKQAGVELKQKKKDFLGVKFTNLKKKKRKKKDFSGQNDKLGLGLSLG